MMKKVIESVQHLILNRNIVYELVKRDITQQYRTSLLGIFWAVLEPISFMILIAFVFDIALRAGRLMEVPFVAYLVTGMSIFSLFSNVLSQGATVIQSNAYLLNKVSFRVSVIPLVKISSQTVTHFFTIFPVLCILIYQDISPSWYWLQAFYYLGALIFLLLGTVWIVSAIGVFVPDIQNIISIMIKFLFYLSPIFWDITSFPLKVQILLKLNPLYYVIQGYRDSFLFHKGFWTHPLLTIYFWFFSIVIFVVGALVFKHLKPHFADFV